MQSEGAVDDVGVRRCIHRLSEAHPTRARGVHQLSTFVEYLVDCQPGALAVELVHDEEALMGSIASVARRAQPRLWKEVSFLYSSERTRLRGMQSTTSGI